jgi:hypothetical protein
MPNATVRPNTAEHPPQPALTSDEVQAPAADFGAARALDPVLALVAKARTAWDRLGEVLIKEGDNGECYDGAQRVFDAAEAELLETPATTLAGATAAIAWLVEYDEPNIPETSGKYMRRRCHAGSGLATSLVAR